MKRLRILVLCSLGVIGVGLTTYFVTANSQHAHKSDNSARSANSGPLTNATVSFGAWMTSPPTDRFPNISNTRFTNHHVVIPEVAKIKAGGTVNFIIAGFHQVIVYDDGTRPDDINEDITVQPTGPGSGLPPLIADATRRIYRGLDPSLQPADRVEVVHFANPGTYLVICGVRPHFVAGMYGYVRVLP